MPQIETWSRLPRAIREHLIERMHYWKIGLDDLNRLRIWMESKPEVPEGPSCTRILVRLSFAVRVPTRKTFLLAGQLATGSKLA